MSMLSPLALTAGIFLIVIGLVAAVAGGLHGGGHIGHPLALVGMVFALAGVLAEGARPHRSNTERRTLPHAHR